MHLLLLHFPLICAAVLEYDLAYAVRFVIFPLAFVGFPRPSLTIGNFTLPLPLPLLIDLPCVPPVGVLFVHDLL